MNDITPGQFIIALLIIDFIGTILSRAATDYIASLRRRKRALTMLRSYTQQKLMRAPNEFVDELVAGLIAQGFQTSTDPRGTITLTRGESTFIIRSNP